MLGQIKPFIYIEGIEDSGARVSKGDLGRVYFFGKELKYEPSIPLTTTVTPRIGAGSGFLHKSVHAV